MKKAAFVCLFTILFLLPLNAQEILDAVLSGDLEKVKSLLNENPALVHTTDQYKNSLLYRALLKDDITMARFLIESGLDVSVQPFLTFDQKYLFFTSKGDIYWADANILEELKPEDRR